MTHTIRTDDTFGAPLADEPPRPSITTWTRLEPRTRRGDMSPALEARIADPLWLLARQWQLGEFTGEDVASPVLVRVHAEAATFTRYRPGTPPASPGTQTAPVDLPAGVPLEAVAERENGDTASDLRFAAETGQQFLRLLTAAGAGALGPAIIARYPLPAQPADAASEADPATVGYLRIVAGRVPDGHRVLRACARGAFNTEIRVPPALVAAVSSAIAQWMAWLGVPLRPPDSLLDTSLLPPAVIAPRASSLQAASSWPPPEFFPFISTPGPEGDAWQRERLEYAFAIGAASSEGEFVLAAPEYDGDRLDWYHFDHAVDQKLQASPAVDHLVRIMLPTPVVYAGMPATRFWEMEDSRINLAQLGAGAGDLARMFLIQYALVYANDHFIIPLELPVGSATRIRSLIVTDTFGTKTLVPPAPDAAGWALFRPTSTPAIAEGPADVLVLPATVAATLDSEPVEEVRLGRDEMANMAWAIERTVTSATGRAIDRGTQVGRAEVPTRPPVPNPPFIDPLTGQPVIVPDLSYALATTLPDNWIPLIPRPTQGRPTDVRLHRVPLQQPSRDGPPVAVTGYSRLLDWRTRPGGDDLVELAIPEEEIGRAGVRVVRQWQLARWSDGSVHLWLGRARHTAGGNVSSGLRYDAVEPRELGSRRPQVTERRLTIRGYRVTIDGRALPHDLVPVSLLDNVTVLSRATTHDLTLIPAAAYVLRALGGPGPATEYRFSLDTEGKISLLGEPGGLIITRPVPPPATPGSFEDNPT